MSFLELEQSPQAPHPPRPPRIPLLNDVESKLVHFLLKNPGTTRKLTSVSLKMTKTRSIPGNKKSFGDPLDAKDKLSTPDDDLVSQEAKS